MDSVVFDAGGGPQRLGVHRRELVEVRIAASALDRYGWVERLLHQTAKTDILSEKWTSVTGYEYTLLWTNESSGKSVNEYYLGFYGHTIQRADVIRSPPHISRHSPQNYPSRRLQRPALSDPIRILPKSLYRKNVKDGEAPHSFFSHFYGSSWHADDAAFIGFLGHWGNKLMLAAVVVLIAGLGFMALPIRQRRQVMCLMGGLSSCWVHDTDRTNDRQRGVLFFLPVSIQPHDVELNPSLEEMRLEKRWHVQEPEDDGPGEYCGSSSSSYLHDV
ncbi:uncharacterized protein ARMOST_08701 [Armillaria ostoyae]|uniref:Uncharacterized protein n=1 Tax=Armillaria ostoyae TaxID=47428 RepID=A0A284R9F1_ARMOS|nr:uncharacterized protein ARMOST_08701 [Armillaria ostoyae]